MLQRRRTDRTLSALVAALVKGANRYQKYIELIPHMYTNEHILSKQRTTYQAAVGPADAGPERSGFCSYIVDMSSVQVL